MEAPVIPELPSVGDCVHHILNKLDAAIPGNEPFRHLFIENVFPSNVYSAIHEHMLACKYGDEVHDRKQDNPLFVTKRQNLYRSKHEIAQLIRGIFSTAEVKAAIARHFYRSASDELVCGMEIHKEFEYFFTKAGRFQQIHVDIPPKVISFVFYIPETPLAPEDEGDNATILYDGSLSPHAAARFRSNSVCIFAPHFNSYHGFHSTRDRDVLVMFYVHKDELQAWREERASEQEGAPYEAIRDAIERKIRHFPMIEIGDDDESIAAARAACLINAPQGRVLRPDDTRPA